MPLLAGSGGAGRAWAAKMAADMPPIARRRSRALPVAAGAFSALFLAAFLGGREAAVAVVPDLAGLYASVGLPVNLDGLTLEGIEAERSTAEGTRLTVRGTIRNIGGTPRPVPGLSLSFRDGAGTPAGSRGFDPPSGSIEPGRAEAFVLEIDDAPPNAADIVLRFRRPGERTPGRTEDGIPAP